MFNPFADGLGDLIGFSQTTPYMAFTIPHHYQSAEAESSPSFYHFGHSVDMNYPVS